MRLEIQRKLYVQGLPLLERHACLLLIADARGGIIQLRLRISPQIRDIQRNKLHIT